MSLNPRRILLVDDEERLLRSIARRMKMLGFETLTATSGTAAIDVARGNSIDMAIVDLQMPDMNGLVTITKLKEIHPDLKTVLLTGHGNDKVKQATESLNTLYFEKDQMGAFWGFIKQLNSDGRIVVIQPPTASSRSMPAGGTSLENHPGNQRDPQI
ncbi:MAG: response regulator, partial [Desulfosarcina sp.]